MESAATILRSSSVEFFVWLHTARDPLQEEWDRHLGLMRGLKQERNGDLSRVRNFVVSEGGAPNFRQRKEMAELFESRPVKFALVTLAMSSPVKRGIASVLSWMNPGFRIFTPDEGRAALAHVDFADGLEELWPVLISLQSRLPTVPVLGTLGGVLLPKSLTEAPARS